MEGANGAVEQLSEAGTEIGPTSQNSDPGLYRAPCASPHLPAPCGPPFLRPSQLRHHGADGSSGHGHDADRDADRVADRSADHVADRSADLVAGFGLCHGCGVLEIDDCRQLLPLIV